MVESDVMLHSSFMSRVGLDIAGVWISYACCVMLCPATPSLMNSHGLPGGNGRRMAANAPADVSLKYVEMFVIQSIFMLDSFVS